MVASEVPPAGRSAALSAAAPGLRLLALAPRPRSGPRPCPPSPARAVRTAPPHPPPPPPAPLSARGLRRGGAAEERSKVCEQYREASGAPEPSARGPARAATQGRRRKLWPLVGARGGATRDGGRRGRTGARGSQRLRPPRAGLCRAKPAAVPRSGPRLRRLAKRQRGKKPSGDRPRPRAARPAPPLLCMRKRSAGLPTPAVRRRPPAPRPCPPPSCASRPPLLHSLRQPPTWPVGASPPVPPFPGSSRDRPPQPKGSGVIGG
ncbi:translation initiation factor IF-2-like [Phacochoerus africanus]|uniref:translation initiation factor IF-2-like n=1 Tax=Phacochoerus africanus TaxID=41426 RepID=UPI001FDA3436|nr:translation initiation factor IF-2-like [Phacochoerus africanus]